MNASRPPFITVLYFAAASTETGLTTEEVELPVSKLPGPESSVGGDPRAGSSATQASCQ